MSVRIIRLEEVMAKTGLARTTIYRYQRSGAFPKPVKLGPRAIGWLEKDVDSWIAGLAGGQQESESVESRP